MTQQGPAPVEGSHSRATYAGRDLRVRSQARDTVSLVDDGGPFPDAVERVDRPGDSYASVPWTSVERLVRRSVHASWRGHRVSLVKVRDDRAGFWYSGDDVDWAVAEGLDGSVRDGGFGGTAPLTDLVDVQVTDTEQPIPGAR